MESEHYALLLSQIDNILGFVFFCLESQGDEEEEDALRLQACEFLLGMSDKDEMHAILQCWLHKVTHTSILYYSYCHSCCSVWSTVRKTKN